MSDLLVGLLVGIVLVVFMNPFKGIIFVIREYQKQIEFLRDGGSQRGSEFKQERQENEPQT